VAWAEGYFFAKRHLYPSSRLATIDVPITGGRAPSKGELGPHLTQRRRAEAYLCTKWDLDPFSRLATIDMGRKLGAPPPFREGSWVPM